MEGGRREEDGKPSSMQARRDKETCKRGDSLI